MFSTPRLDLAPGLRPSPNTPATLDGTDKEQTGSVGAHQCSFLFGVVLYIYILNAHARFSLVLVHVDIRWRCSAVFVA